MLGCVEGSMSWGEGGGICSGYLSLFSFISFNFFFFFNDLKALVHILSSEGVMSRVCHLFIVDSSLFLNRSFACTAQPAVNDFPWQPALWKWLVIKQKKKWGCFAGETVGGGGGISLGKPKEVVHVISFEKEKDVASFHWRNKQRWYHFIGYDAAFLTVL